MTCTTCHSDDWKLASFVHKEGLSHVNTKTSGGGLVATGSGLGFGAGNAKTTGTQQSQTSKEAAPPSGMLLSMVLGITTVVFLAMSMLASHWFLLLVAASVYGLYKIYPGEKSKHAAAMERYRRTRICQRCGTFYLPPAQA